MSGAFGEYSLITEIGHGSTGRVYSARKQSGALVALKVFDLGKGRDDITAVRRFLTQEFGLVRSLNHPNIIKYLDAGLIDDTPYIAMELLAFGNLETRIQLADFLPVDDIVSLLSPLSDALDYAHGRRVLHRDIKPSNILFADDGRPVLSDFGIARVIRPREDTQTGSTLPGTSDFMAPEVMRESPESPASDIYSLGITVFFAFCGKLPTDGRTLYRRSHDRVEGRLISLKERNPLISAEISDVVMRCLSTEPRARYVSARAFAGALTLAASGMAIGVADGGSSQARRGGRKWLSYWQYVIVPLIVAIIGAIAAWLSASKK